MVTTDLLLRIYRTVQVPVKPKYPPIRKHYNIVTFG